MEDGTLYFLHTDHLGSATLTTDASGWVGEARYTPYGETRRGYPVGMMPTDRRYTGQRWDGALSLYDYRARYYDPLLGRFISADPLVPEPGNPQELNRYSYARNNPLLYTDPSGHFVNLAFAAVGAMSGAIIGAVAAAGPQIIQNIRDGQPLMTNIDTTQVARAAAIGMAAGAVGGLTFGVGLALGSAVAGAAGISAGSGIAASIAGGVTVAASGVMAGQTSRAVTNLLTGADIREGLFQPGDMIIDAVVSVILFKGLGGNFEQIAPSDITKPGAYARESIPVRGGGPRQPERDAIQLLGNRYGCHTCGARTPGGTGRWWVDEQPPNALASGAPQRGYPQCASCGARQGGYISQGTTALVYHIWQGAWRSYYSWGPLWQLWDRKNGD